MSVDILESIDMEYRVVSFLTHLSTCRLAKNEDKTYPEESNHRHGARHSPRPSGLLTQLAVPPAVSFEWYHRESTAPSETVVAVVVGSSSRPILAVSNL